MPRSKHPTQLNKKKEDKRYKAWKFRLYPTSVQADKLEWTLRRCCELYNACLQERKDAHRMCHVSVTFSMQSAQLPAMKQEREEYQDIYAQVLQEVLHRVEKTFNAFFKRVQEGQKSGSPRFKGSDRYDSFTYPQGGYEIIGKKLSLSKIGKIRIKKHREMEGTIKTCSIKHEGSHWYAVFTTELAPQQTPVYHPTGEAVGIDLGLLRFATLSTGQGIQNPRYGRRAAERLAVSQQQLARKQRGSHRRTRAKEQVSHCFRKMRNQRRVPQHR